MKAPHVALMGATLLLAGGGCATREGAVEGVVYASPVACNVRGNVLADEEPLADAVVRLRCDGDETVLTKTHSNGRVHYEGTEELRTDCEIVVTKEGYRAEALRIDDICVDRSKGRCSLLAITADMEPI